MENYEFKPLDDLLLDLQGAEIQKNYIANKQTAQHDTDFSKFGICTYEIPNDVSDLLQGFFDESLRVDFSADDCSEEYWGSQLSQKTVNELGSGPINFQDSLFL